MEKMYMNAVTGSVDTHDGWIYSDEAGTHDPVAEGTVVEVEMVDGSWKEVAQHHRTYIRDIL